MLVVNGVPVIAFLIMEPGDSGNALEGRARHRDEGDAGGGERLDVRGRGRGRRWAVPVEVLRLAGDLRQGDGDLLAAVERLRGRRR